MTNEHKDFILKLKYYHIIIIACLLSPLLIINSNYVNNKRATIKLNKEKARLFDKILLKRKLQEEEKAGEEEKVGGEETETETPNLEGSDKVCAKGSEELVEYYKTGDLEKIGLTNDSIKCEVNDEDYFKSLKKILKSLLGEGDSSESTSNEDSQVDLRNLQGDILEQQDDLIAYGMHILPILIFFVIGILSLPAWPICCFCCCCNCCCCCCCKKPGCKIPCFIFTYIFYGLSVAICIYGLSQSNHIFVGLADTECSLLKFFDQILDGEMKEERPRWAGIETINKFLGNITTQIGDLKHGTMGELEESIRSIDNNKGIFLTAMDESGSNFYKPSPDTGYLDYYAETYSNLKANGRTISGTYVLDLIKMFGNKKTGGGFTPENSILDIWEKEYKIVSENADGYIETARKSFESMIDDGSGDILGSLNEGKDILDEIKESFNDIKSEISDMIIDYSDTIDEYGKLGFKLVFGVLALMNVALGVFILFICLFSGKMCTNCCCCRCIFKFFTHLLWNILALLMFITFMVGFLFSFVGQIGNDGMNLISFVVSEDNLGKNGTGGERMLVDQLGEGINYLDRCINGDGKIEEELDLDMDQLNSFDQVNEVEEKINETKVEFEQKKTFVAYNLYKGELEKRLNLTSDELMLVEESATIDTTFDYESAPESEKSKYLNFKVELELMNNLISEEEEHHHHRESWKRDARTSDKKCRPGGSNDDSNSEPYVYYPQNCRPFDRDWIYEITDPDPLLQSIRGGAKILTDTLEKLDNAKDLSLTNGYLTIINDLKYKYEQYLDQYIITLENFGRIINQITGQLKEYINKDEGVFSFMRCNFIGTNLKVILKYLKSALGNDIKTIGTCLSIVGCSLALSISSTILLIVIINISIDENKKKIKEEENDKVPEYPMNSQGRIIRYQ